MTCWCKTITGVLLLLSFCCLLFLFGIKNDHIMATHHHVQEDVCDNKNPQIPIDPSSIDFLPKIQRPPLQGMNPEHPYENVIFQGGGAKGLIYTGAFAALEELHVSPYLKRFAGSSAGSFAALAGALGLDAQQLTIESQKCIQTVEDGPDTSNPLNWFQIIKTILDTQAMGINPGIQLFECLGDFLETYTGVRDLTFRQLYETYGTELCVPISNLSRSQSELCHVKTTPDMPIRKAVRISMSLPIVLFIESVAGRESKIHGKDILIDGGLYNNFPLRVFDGWGLSMDPQDEMMIKYVSKYSPITEDMDADEIVEGMRDTMRDAFEGPNSATIGFRLSTAYQPDPLIQYFGGKTFSNSNDSLLAKDYLPQTKLATKFKKSMEDLDGSEQEQKKYKDAFKELTRWALVNYDLFEGRSLASKEGMPIQTFLNALQKVTPRDAFRPEVFGFSTFEEYLTSMDKHGKGVLFLNDLATSFDDNGSAGDIVLQKRAAAKVDGVGGYLFEILMSVMLVMEEPMLQQADNLSRSCTLDCVYIQTTDFVLEAADVEFIMEHGRQQAMSFLRQRSKQLLQQDQSLPSSTSSSVSRGLVEAKVAKLESLKQEQRKLEQEIEALGGELL